MLTCSVSFRCYFNTVGSDFLPEQPPPIINANLPTPTLSNLLEIEKQIRSVHRAGPIRVRVAENVVSSDLVRKLVVLMKDAEDLQSIEDLHSFCLIMQAIRMCYFAFLIYLILISPLQCY
jgi:hypothetical protein